MKIFVDFHHEGLFNSLQMLFEERLGHELYRPIGQDWFNEGYWMIAKPYGNALSTVAQYLDIRDLHRPFIKNEIKSEETDHYVVKGAYKNHRAITLKQFKEMDIDIVIASYNDHISVYADLIKKYKPKAKLIHQMGNEWNVDFSTVKNLLASTLLFNVPNSVNAVFYHQEFDLNIYKYTPPQESKYVRSFVNCLNTQPHLKKDWQDFLELENLASSLIFESYGATCKNGTLNRQLQIAEFMSGSKWGIHLKNGGDGYGHVIHGWAAVGRPLIYRGSQYKNKLAGELLVNYVTGIDLDLVDMMKAASEIIHISQEQYLTMCQNIHSHFKKTVDFDKEQKSIENFLQNLR